MRTAIYLACILCFTTAASQATAAEPAGGPELTAEEKLIDEIVVIGMKDVVASSLDEKKQSDSLIDVLSAGDAARFPDNNVAEALGRLPGVTFMRDSDSGNGEFISIRGLDAGLNNIQFNGVNSATANPGDRRVSLDGIATAGINKIVVKKVLMPADDAVGIGGSVDIVSINPLDLTTDSNLTAEANLIDQSFADDLGSHLMIGGHKQLSDTFAVSGAVDLRNRKLRNFTIEPSTAGIGTSIVTLPAVSHPDGTPFDYDSLADDSDNPNDPLGARAIRAVDVAQLLLNTHGLVPVETLNADRMTYQMDDSDFDTLTLNLVAGWEPTENTSLQFGGYFSNRETDNSEQGLEFDSRSEFVDLDADGAFENRRVASQAIETVYALEDQTATNATAYIKGDSDLGRVSLGYGVSYSRAEQETNATRMRFRTSDAPWPEGFAPFDFSNPIYPIPAFTQFVDDTVSATGLTAMQLNDLDVGLEDFQVNTRYAAHLDVTFDIGSRFLETVTIGAKYEESETDHQEWSVDVDNATDASGMFLGDGGGDLFTLADSNLFSSAFEDFSDVNGGLSRIQVPVLSANNLRAFRSTFLGSFDYNDPEYTWDEYDTLTEEDELAVYLQAEFNLTDDITLTAGARGSWYNGSFWTTRTQSNFFFIAPLTAVSIPDMVDRRNTPLTATTDNFELLPRGILTWRPNEKTVVRLAGSASIARPAFNQLSAKTDLIFFMMPSFGYQLQVPTGATFEEMISSMTTDDLRTNFLLLDTGNPDLENSKSYAWDLSVEYYVNDTTALTAALFHKRVPNVISVNQASVSSISDQDRFISLIDSMEFSTAGQLLVDQLGGGEAIVGASNASLSISIASNDAKSEVRGIELGFAHGFDWAPGLLGNLGAFGNVTWQDTEIEYPAHVYGSRDFLVQTGEVESGDTFKQRSQLFNAPDLSGNLGLYFARDNIFSENDVLDMTLSMSYTDQLYIDDGGYGLPRYEQDYTQWDFSAVYELDAKIDTQVFFRAVDLFDSGGDPTTLETTGASRQVPQRSTFNGRELQFGIRVNF